MYIKSHDVSCLFSQLLLVASLGLLWLLALGLTPIPAFGQSPTPVTSILNGGSSTVLEVSYSGGLLAPGKFADISNYSVPGDSIPATGAGTRMMWYPEKAAFRAGRVGRSLDNADVWDASNIGEYSVAFGVDTEASGNRTTAMGQRSTASGDVATATGFATTAVTDRSLSIGECNSANTSVDNSLLVAGNGSDALPRGSCDSRSDALVLDQSGNLTIGGTLTEGSDRRLKTGIEPLGEGTLQKLNELRPVRYEFKDQSSHPSGEQIGLVAQDVQTEFPSLVSKSAGGYLSLAYPKMTAVILKGIQEQQAELEKKQVQIDSLKGRVQRLKKQQQEIDRVKGRLAALEAERNPSVMAGLTGPVAGLLLGLFLGGLLGAGLLWRRRAAGPWPNLGAHSRLASHTPRRVLWARLLEVCGVGPSA